MALPGSAGDGDSEAAHQRAVRRLHKRAQASIRDNYEPGPGLVTAETNGDGMVPGPVGGASATGAGTADSVSNGAGHADNSGHARGRKSMPRWRATTLHAYGLRH